MILLSQDPLGGKLIKLRNWAQVVDDYYQLLEWDKLPVVKGHLLTREDLIIRKHILNLMCQFETSWSDDDHYLDEIPQIVAQLHEMEKDGLLII